MRTLQRFLSFTIVGLALAAGSCGGSTASIEQSWRSPNARVGELTNVVTFCRARTETVCRNAEDALARKLNARGVRASPSHAVLTDEDLRDRANALAKLRGSGFDGVVTMRFVSAEQKLEYYPSFDTYWGGTYSDAIPETVVRIEVSAYSLTDNQLVWSALSKSIDPADTHQVVEDVSGVVSRELDKKQVVGKTMPGEG